MQAAPADSKVRSEYNLPSISDYYRRFTNPNTFISNNANPFLISPYSPNQVNGTAVQSIFYVNTIKPLTPTGTIQIQGNVNIATPYKLLLNGNQMYTDRIYSGGLLGSGVDVICDTPTTTLNVNVNTITKFSVNQTDVTSTVPILTPSIFTSSLNMTNTGIVAAGALAGYIPITVDIGTGAPVSYKIAVYNP
uniref:Uncharacterized protein n=1 Tax=viral metagenome TaxID=1070528 RepID=A0A6C0AQ65_9ZZZZ